MKNMKERTNYWKEIYTRVKAFCDKIIEVRMERKRKM